MDSRESELRVSQIEIEKLKILNKVYDGTLKRIETEYFKYLTYKKNDTAKLQRRREVIRIIKWNLKARKEKIDYLKSRIEELKKSLKQGMSDAMFILNNKGYKPKEFWIASKYI